jgi:hypothetical protein
LKAYPNIYDERYTLDCAVNFKNLEQVVMPYLSTSMGEARNRIESSIKLLQRYATMDQFSNDMEALLYKVLNRTAVYDPRGCYRTPDWAVDNNGAYLSYEAATGVAAERCRAGLPVYKPHAEVDANFLLGITLSPPPPSTPPPSARRQKSVQPSTRRPQRVNKVQHPASPDPERLAIHIRHTSKPSQRHHRAVPSTEMAETTDDAPEAVYASGSQQIELPEPHHPHREQEHTSRNALSRFWHVIFG